MGDPQPGDVPPDLEQVVSEVVREAHVREEELRPEEREFLKEHALKKPMGVLHIWALGVGAVIAGEYFGWNPGLKEGGPIGMLLASLFVCALYMAWVLSLTELSVAMPFAGGPLAYGRRAVGPAFGFIMGWSMFLEALFATIGTAIGTGGALYFIVQLLWPEGLESAVITFGLVDPSAGDIKETALLAATTARLAATTVFGLLAVCFFGALQWVGVKEQAKVMEWMTYGAIVGLVWFWSACIPGVRIERIWTTPLLLTGWLGAVKAIPYAIWWLVMIETVALAPEEAHEPHRSIPRGLTLAQMTLIVLVVLTWFFVSAAGSSYETTGDDSQAAYPLQFVYKEVWSRPSDLPHVAAFSMIAIFGMVASYNGMIYAVSRQSFSLGRAGYLPRILGHVHATRRTPDVSIIFWSLVVAGFVIWGYFNQSIIMDAVLICNLTALTWYVLAMVCLFILRVREPDMERPYKVPLYPILPALVIVMSAFAAVVYGWLSKPIVLWLTPLMYGVGCAYYFGLARSRLETAAPEELSARAAEGK